MSTFTVGVIDNTCEAADQTFFPPGIRLVVQSSTRVGQILGFDEYTPSNPPKRYRKLTWAGTSEAQLWWYPPYNGIVAAQLGGAKFTYSGSSEIDLHGNYVQLYTKELSAMCNASASLVTSLAQSPAGGFDNYTFAGWLGPTGHEKCTPPGIPYSDVGNQAIGKGQSARSDSSALWGSRKVSGSNIQESNFLISSSTQAACVDANADLNASVIISLFEPVPDGTVQSIDGGNEGTVWFLSPVLWNHNYSATLSEEYTEAQALSITPVHLGNNPASSYTRNGFTITQITVAFQLQCSNLLKDSAYTVTYDLANLTTGTSSTVSIGFTATATTHNISGSIPLPSGGQQVVVRNPTITFTPP